jgi:hypothetical protein
MASISELNDEFFEIFDEDDTNEFNDHKLYRSISSDKHSINKQKEINDLLSLSSLMSYHINSDNILSSESRLIHSKFQRLFHFLGTDIYNEPMKQALGDQISNLDEVNNALINLNRNATLKFRNYKQFREHVCFCFFFIIKKNTF